ncbi:MAG: DUF393 domain-containing protein [Myxococcota bacterium]|nr:DUF393 domain-containing protein [Myxococcota bacterium]
MEPEVTLFVDEECPFCRVESASLREADREGALRFVDISAPDFDATEHGLDPVAVRQRLHARTSDGRLWLGLDGSRVAWRRVGRRGVIRFTEWPLLRGLLDRVAYPLFARVRVPLGRALSWLLRLERPATPQPPARRGPGAGAGRSRA